jgi:hypothetical protein
LLIFILAEDALEIDAKEIDNEIIASRLHRDVVSLLFNYQFIQLNN